MEFKKSNPAESAMNMAGEFWDMGTTSTALQRNRLKFI
jgi:hypothetical protein